MARPVTIKELEASVRWQADYQRALLRHTSDDVRLAINNSLQRFREIISDEGYTYFLKIHNGNLPAGLAKDPDNGRDRAWGELDISSFEPEVVRVYGIDVKINNWWNRLTAASLLERNDYQTRGDNSRYPVAFFMYDETKIGILPPSREEYEFNLLYLPLLPPLLNDEDVFNPAVPAGDEWVIWDVMLKLIVRDNYPSQYGIVQSKLAELMKDILNKAGKLQISQPLHRLDTRGHSMQGARDWLSHGLRS